MLARMFDRRCRGYEAVGYTILLPGSAVPGWPTDVPLPVTSEWKGDHAASVRRLARDGVNAPLAQLFATATAAAVPVGEGGDWARSATEAFLYQRLETLPETAGLFRLNQQLPIPFDGWGHMEVDLLCAEHRIAIELDGSQHLDSADAYRRDRRKDRLLQEHGYFVVRFLVADVRTQLAQVLDTILRTLTHQQGLSEPQLRPVRH
jgi:very-short-patch-repair endonuclease